MYIYGNSLTFYMGLVAKKTFFKVSDKVRHKSTSSLRNLAI